MKLVVDSNVLFTFFWKNSVFHEISSMHNLQLFSPTYALKEINKYSSEIMKKAKLSREEFNRLKRELAMRIDFVSLKEYSTLFKQAKSLSKTLSGNAVDEFLNDIDFFALALKLKCPIWTNDKLFKKQSQVLVFTTKEIILLLSQLHLN